MVQCRKRECLCEDANLTLIFYDAWKFQLQFLTHRNATSPYAFTTSTPGLALDMMASPITGFAALQIYPTENVDDLVVTPEPRQFFALPRELRDRIYHYAWTGFNASFRVDAASSTLVEARYFYDEKDTVDIMSSKSIPRWAHTSHQFRIEALDSFTAKRSSVLERVHS
jgi:hypothetical protein